MEETGKTTPQEEVPEIGEVGMEEETEIVNEEFEKLKSFIDKLPEQEKVRPILALDGKLYNWEDILEEVKKGGELKDKIKDIIKEKIE